MRLHVSMHASRNMVLHGVELCADVVVSTAARRSKKVGGCDDVGGFNQGHALNIPFFRCKNAGQLLKKIPTNSRFRKTRLL